MGQYGNQPDFGTRGSFVTPLGDPANGIDGQNLNSAALYIGTGGDLFVRIIDGTDLWFRNIPNGTFFPVIVSNVWAANDGDPTTCANIVALY